MSSRSVNKVVLIGHLTRDAETKFTPGGTAVTKFAVATNRRWKDKQSDEWKEEVNYTNVILWQQEKVGEYLTRGKQVYVEGRIQTRSYDDKDGKKVCATEVVADDVILLGGQGEGHSAGGGNSQTRATASSGAARSSRPSSSATATAIPDDHLGISDEDVPF